MVFCWRKANDQYGKQDGIIGSTYATGTGIGTTMNNHLVGGSRYSTGNY